MVKVFQLVLALVASAGVVVMAHESPEGHMHMGGGGHGKRHEMPPELKEQSLVFWEEKTGKTRDEVTEIMDGKRQLFEESMQAAKQAVQAYMVAKTGATAEQIDEWSMEDRQRMRAYMKEHRPKRAGRWGGCRRWGGVQDEPAPAPDAAAPEPTMPEPVPL
jgi:3-oxoacyl-[acyl-carrier-protein] synthase III